MNVSLDGLPINVTTTATVGELVEQVRTQACSQGQVILSILVDGLDITDDDLEKWLASSTDDVEQVEFQTGSAGPLVIDALDQALSVLDDTDATRAKVVDSLTAGSSREASEGLATCFARWHQVHTAIAQSVNLLGLDVRALQVDGVSMEETLTQITELLAQVKEVLQADDQVLLADLLQYEFDRAIDAWKGAIDTVKSCATNSSIA